MQHKLVPLLIKGADDDSGTPSPGLASVVDYLDYDGDLFVEGPSVSHSVTAHADAAGLDARG